jgi:alpha-L-fucosidase
MTFRLPIRLLGPVFIPLTAALAGCGTSGPAPAAPDASARQDPTAPTAQTAESLARWQSLRFGLFIHWGPVSLKGVEIGWGRGGERRGRRGSGPVPVEVYDNLYKEFNPVKFDADEWVAIAKAAGMKYLVFTTKHHDGFCNFDSKLTDYKITSPLSPYRKDIVRQLADACRKGGLGLGFYYSQPDWHHPDYRAGDRHARYIDYLHGQIRELCANYGKVDILWFDGLEGRAADWDALRLIGMIRTLQPAILINSRCNAPCDFSTPEQRIGRFDRERPWESCITLGSQWAWKPDDALKSLAECVHTLVRCAGGDGNLLLNVGPMPTGEIEPRQVERLKEMGAWLGKHGESVYGTRGGPFKPGAWGASTFKANVVYVHVLKPEAAAALALPAVRRKIVRAGLLTGGTVDIQQKESGITLTVPVAHRQAIDTIVKLELDGPAADIEPAGVEAPVGEASTKTN